MPFIIHMSKAINEFSCRWLCYCHVPHFCDSLQRHEVTAIFGQNMLKSIFSLMKQQLLDRFAAEKEKLPPETRVMVLTYFPRYQIALFIVINWFGSYISLLEAQRDMPLLDNASEGNGRQLDTYLGRRSKGLLTTVPLVLHVNQYFSKFAAIFQILVLLG